MFDNENNTEILLYVEFYNVSIRCISETETVKRRNIL